MPNKLDWTSLAAHEAGHAVAAVVLRLSLRYVTLRPRGPEDALTYTRTKRNESPDYLERQAVCDLAGFAAEQLLNGRVIWMSWTGDKEHAEKNAERLGVEDVEEFLRVKQHTKRESRPFVAPSSRGQPSREQRSERSSASRRLRALGSGPGASATHT